MILENRWYFLAVQLLLGISLFIGIRFFHRLDIRYRHLLGSILLMDAHDTQSRIVPSGNPMLDTMIVKYNEIIAEIHQQQLQLESQGKFLEELIQSSPIGIVITDFDGMVTDINTMALNILDISAALVLGNHIEKVVPEQKVPAANTPITITYGQKRLKLSKNQVRYKGFLRQSLIIEDITYDLLQSEKEAYGRVIRMMAHEVNNSAAAVNSILETLSDYLEEINAGQDWQEAIQIAQNRNKNLGIFVDNFASVLRIYPPNLQATNLFTLAEKVAQFWLFKAQVSHIEIQVKDLRPHKSKLFLDPIQIEQVLHNILKNSLEAIEGAGSIQILVGPEHHNLRILDNGVGINSETVKAITERPFYSTKQHGQGIGMMLIKEILHLHKAHFKLETLDNGWTEFSIFFSTNSFESDGEREGITAD